MTIGERIKKIRKDKNLTQQDFSGYIDVKRNTVALYEANKIVPSAAVVSLICRTFHVDEEWLRTGAGEPYLETTRNDELFAWAERLAAETGDSFPKRLALALSRLNEKGWEVLADIATDLMEQKDKAPAKPPAPAEASARFTEEELAAYRKVRAAMEKEAFDAETAALHAELDRQREAEKRAAPASSAGSSDTASLIGRKILTISPKA